MEMKFEIKSEGLIKLLEFIHKSDKEYKGRMTDPHGKDHHRFLIEEVSSVTHQDPIRTIGYIVSLKACRTPFHTDDLLEIIKPYLEGYESKISGRGRK